MLIGGCCGRVCYCYIQEYCNGQDITTSLARSVFLGLIASVGAFHCSNGFCGCLFAVTMGAYGGCYAGGSLGRARLGSSIFSASMRGSVVSGVVRGRGDVVVRGTLSALPSVRHRTVVLGCCRSFGIGSVTGAAKMDIPATRSHVRRKLGGLDGLLSEGRFLG